MITWNLNGRKVTKARVRYYLIIKYREVFGALVLFFLERKT